MKFGQRFSIRKDLDTGEFARGIWNPTVSAWRDVIEDYLYISRKRINNKLSMFKLQFVILGDLVSNVKIIDSYKSRLEDLKVDKEKGKIEEEEYRNDEKSIKSEIYAMKLINKALREIVDGIVWRYFNFNRALLYVLADKAPIEALRPNEGLITSLYEFSEVFLKPDDFAVLNDITNFLRVGDVTQIKKDGSIEFIEVKSSKWGGSRITRQKQRMAELVEFFNTGLKEYDGGKLKILNSDIKQRNFLKIFLNSIRKARYRGYDSVLLGNNLMLEIADFRKVNGVNGMIEYFKSRHRSIQDKWKQKGDFVVPMYFIDKLDYSKNYTPYSIFPFDVDICADILMGRLMIFSYLNYSEIIRVIEKAGWEIIDSPLFRSKEEIEKLKGTEWEDIVFLRVRKSQLIVDIPPSWFGRLQFELLSPKVIIEDLEQTYRQGPTIDYDRSLVNYLDEQRIWK